MSPNRAFGSAPTSGVPLCDRCGPYRRGRPGRSRQEGQCSLFVSQSVYEFEISSGSARNWRQEPKPIAKLGGCFSSQRLQGQVRDDPPPPCTLLPCQMPGSGDEIVVEFQGRPHTCSVTHHASI